VRLPLLFRRHKKILTDPEGKPAFSTARASQVAEIGARTDVFITQRAGKDINWIASKIFEQFAVSDVGRCKF
jgi:hypothetical protein